MKEAADKFVDWANSRFESDDADEEVMDTLPKKKRLCWKSLLKH